MQLLVSVTDAGEARAAVRGGADFVDAKNPRLGALGPVTIETFREIRAAVDGASPLSAALGDVGHEAAITRTAGEFAAAGAAFVKVGFRGTSEADGVRTLLRAIVEATRNTDPDTKVVAVAYADSGRVPGPGVPAVLDAAGDTGAAGLLIDTADKAGPGLLELVDPSVLRSWIAEAHAAGLWVAVAGKLSGGDLGGLVGSGADIAGVRGAACTGGRTGRVSVGRVRALKDLCSPPEEFRTAPNR